MTWRFLWIPAEKKRKSRSPRYSKEAEPDALTPTSNAPAVPSSSSQTSAAQRVQAATPVVDEAPPANAPWLLVGLSGAGAVLAGGLLAALRQRRRAQFRARRPGRTIAVPPPELIPVEKTITSQGAAALPTLTIIDEALKLLAASAGDADALPDLVALQLLPGAHPALTTVTRSWARVMAV